MSSAPSSSLRPAYPVLVLLAGSVLWGLSWLPLKYFGSYGLRGVAVTLVGYGSVGVLALGLLLKRRALWRQRWRGLLVFLLVGGVANLSFASAIVSGEVVRVMVLFYLLPAWGVLGAYLWLGERVDTVRKLAVAAALGGAFLILGGPKVLAQPPSASDVLAVVSGMALAINNVWFRKLDQLAVVDKIASMFVGCLLLALPLWLLGVQTLPSGVPALVWAQLAAFGLCWLLAATIGTQWGVAHMEAGRSSVLIIMELVTAVASAAVIEGTHLQGIEWLGGALIVAAALAEARRAT